MNTKDSESGPNPTINSGAADVPDFSVFIGKVTVPVNNYKRCKDAILPLVQQAQTAGKDLTNRQIAEILHQAGYADRVLSDSCIRKYIISAEHGSEHVLSDKQIANRRDKTRRRRQQRLDRSQRLDKANITPVHSPTDGAATAKAKLQDPEPELEEDEIVEIAETLTDEVEESETDTESKETPALQESKEPDPQKVEGLNKPALRKPPALPDAPAGGSATFQQLRPEPPAEPQRRKLATAADMEEAELSKSSVDADDLDALTS